MCVATNTDLGEANERGIAAVTVDGIDPKPGHRKAYAPIVLTSVCDRLQRDVVSVIDDDRNFLFCPRNARMNC